MNAHAHASTGQSALTPSFPVETEIYLLPTGEVIVADLPAELLAMTRNLGAQAAPGPAALKAAQTSDPAPAQIPPTQIAPSQRAPSQRAPTVPAST